MTEGRVEAVCISSRSGMPRPIVMQGELREGLGFVGNRHSVGGQREVCLYDAETYATLREEGMHVGPGSFGENLTLSGIDFAAIQSGDRIAVGDEAVIEITIVRVPCRQLTPIDERLPQAVVGRSGWMARVVTGGIVRPGDAAWLVREE